jgi:uncharacterized membrane protein
MAPGRLHALVDGVFAIAITLLVLDLPRPADSHQLAHDLLQQWPAYAAFVVSFVTVAILWVEHLGMLSAVRRVDRRFVERTLLLLLFVTVIPWPTALAAEYVQRGSQASTAAVLYGGTMFLLAASFTWSWRYLAFHPDLVSAPARPAIAAGFRRALLGTLPYLLAVALAPASPPASFALDAAVAAYFALSRTRVPGLVAAAAD